MRMSKIITKEARKFIISQIHDNGQMSKSEIAELIRPHCSFDPMALQEQALNRLVGSICRSIRDGVGVRTVFIAKGHDAVVNVETTTSLPLISAVDDQIKANITDAPLTFFLHIRYVRQTHTGYVNHLKGTTT